MFEKLKNSARINLRLQTDGPLLIQAGDATAFDPSLPDMYAIRTFKDGDYRVLLPGSSIKGVIRSRYESIVNGILEQDDACCNITGLACKTKDNSIENIYHVSCPACKLFGSTMMAGRIRFADAYTVKEPVMGHRHGVGIDRITGGTARKVKYNYEIIEEAEFHVSIWLENYELYQAALLMQVLEDIDEGFAGFGTGITRGNGHMKVKSCEIMLREYRAEVNRWKGCCKPTEGGELSYSKNKFYYEAGPLDREEIISLLPGNEILIDNLKKDMGDKRRKSRG